MRVWGSWPASEREERPVPAWLGGPRCPEASYRSRLDSEACLGSLAWRVHHEGVGRSLADSSLPCPVAVQGAGNVIMTAS